MSERCPVCGLEFPDRNSAWLHFIDAHSGKRTPNDARPAAPPLPDAGLEERWAHDEVRHDQPAGAPPAGGIIRQSWDNGPATTVIIAITVAAWALDRALHYGWGIEITHALAGNGLLGTDGQWWRLVTPLLVHYGPLHIIFNMLWVYQIGPPIERLMGKYAFVGTYLATGVAGNVCSDLVYYRTPNFASGGASGSVYGLAGVLVGGWLTAKLLDRDRTHPPPPGAIEFNDVAVRSLAIMFGLWLVAAQVLVRNVDSAAHFGGGLLGLIIGAALAWRHNGPRARAAGLP